MREPAVSVLITTYNHGRFVGEAIESLLSQDFPPDRFEIPVVDDGSTDDTQERVKKYGERIRYFYRPNGGQAAALNYGIARAFANRSRPPRDHSRAGLRGACCRLAQLAFLHQCSA